MANSKNTIQRIPLNGMLNMNTLKTEVKQFEGFNEKNSTVFGGTLSPFYDKTSDLFSSTDSYTVFNSKGQSFSLVKENDRINLYRDKKLVEGIYGNMVTETRELNVPNHNTVVAVGTPDGGVLYVTKDGKVYKDDKLVHTFTISDVVEGQIWYSENAARIVVINKTHYDFVKIDSHDYTVLATYYFELKENLTDSSVPMLTGGIESTGLFKICIVPNAGRRKGPPYKGTPNLPDRLEQKARWIDGDGGYNVNSTEREDFYLVEDFSNPGYLLKDKKWVSSPYDGTTEIYPYSLRGLSYVSNRTGTSPLIRETETFNYTDYLPFDFRFCGVQDGFVPCPVGPKYSKDGSIYYMDGSIISIGHLNQPIAPPLSFNRIMISTYRIGNTTSFTYQTTDYKWYCYSAKSVSDSEVSKESLKEMVFDKRYLFIKNNEVGLTIYDIEEDRIEPKVKELDWILAEPPVCLNLNTYEAIRALSDTVTGSVYCSGVNAGYMINNAKFIGYLPNPYVVNFSPPLEMLTFPKVPDSAQFYCSTGSTVQSAKYVGNDPQFYGTTYAIDSNSNVIIPVSQKGEIVSGYSNNDLVIENHTTYPLMYWNNNQKTYSYFLLSGIENMTNVFSLQGQSYAVDDSNIYTTSFSNGVVSNVTPVCYKKNMDFKGTLPTQAIFWSDFNKSFYAFTGDRVLTKMFEASDIGEIKYVGQNPSSLSLWFCTDKGIYVISDTDTYKLNYNASYVDFYKKFAMIVVDGEENQELHLVSLYDVENDAEMVPVKLKTAYYGINGEQKAVMDCWYLRLFDENRTEGDVKVKVNTITDVTRHTEEKVFHVKPSDYDDNNIVYLRYQPKYQECTAMQLELESPIGIYELAIGVNATDSTAQISKISI
ncbi:MAG: hypothetical protein MJZ50_01700 [Treponema sp.]|nr:hypothetical protein [Treponema sp.]